MVKLFCAMVGLAESAFEVEIDVDQTVGDLKDAIKKKKKSDLKDVDADKLQLFLAKKGGKWLTEKDVAKGVKITAGLTTLDVAGAPLNVVGLLKKDVQFRVTKEHVIDKTTPVHVLVVVREGAGGSASETSKLDQVVQEVHEIHAKLDKTVLGKRKVCHSSASWSLLDDLHVRVRASRAVSFKPERRVEPFTWGYIVDERGVKSKLTEEQQRERYREYVEVNIGDALAKNQLCVYGVEKGDEILSTDVPGHNIAFVGRTDMIILSDQVLKNPLDLRLLPSVRLIIEVKKKVESRSICQAVSELIALDILAVEPVMALLTDLTKHWQFFWVADPTNNRGTIESVTICDPSKAFAVIETLLARTGAGAQVRLPCFQEPIKRQKISGSWPLSEMVAVKEFVRASNDIMTLPVS